MTPERKARLEGVLKKRQGNLGLVLEDVHDPHNIYACLRSADATGVQDVYIIHTKNQLSWDAGKRSSASAVKWITIHHFTTVKECMEVVRKRYEIIAGTYVQEDATNLYEMNLCQSMALVFGNERQGISEAMREHMDVNFRIPMMGMVRSLNISVACAVTLYEALRQRNEAGMFDKPMMAEAEFQSMLSRWTEREKQKWME